MKLSGAEFYALYLFRGNFRKSVICDFWLTLMDCFDSLN